MKVKFFCTRWGIDDISLDEFTAKAKDAGYDGIEIAVPSSQAEKDQLREVLNKYEMLHIAGCGIFEQVDIDQHKKLYRELLTSTAQFKPLFINCHSGKDHYTYQQNIEFIKIADEISAQTGVKILHETHRGRFSFAAHVLSEYLDKLPDLQIGLDISHWFNVAESYLLDQKQAVDKVVSRTAHIHARIGHPESPPIPDPRDQYWTTAIDRHIEIWDKVIENAKNNGKEYFTITPEFGPPDYMIKMPLTGLPITSQWDINLHIKNLLDKRYN